MAAVLVIEDDDRIRLSLLLALEDEGYAVRGAATAEEGLAAHRQDPADTRGVPVFDARSGRTPVCTSVSGLLVGSVMCVSFVVVSLLLDGGERGGR